MFPKIALFVTPPETLPLPRNPAREWRIVENQLPAQILNVTPNGGGRLDVGLVIDCSPSMLDERKMIAAKGAAAAFLQQLRLTDGARRSGDLTPEILQAPGAGVPTGEGDRAAVLRFQSQSELVQPLTSERDDLLAAVGRLSPSGSDTAFLDAVLWTVRHLAPTGGSVTGAGRPDARRVVVALTDGMDNASVVSLDSVIQQARAAGVAVCTVGLGSDCESGLLHTLALQTGGRFLHSPTADQLQQLYRDLARDLRQEWRIDYRSPNPAADGSRRDVIVQLTPDLQAATWYQAPRAARGMMEGGPSVTWSSPGVSLTSARKDMPGNTPLALPRPWRIGILVGLTGMLLALVALLIRRLGARPAAPPDLGSQLPALWMDRPMMTIGRDASCEVVVEGAQVSRRHARLEAREGEVWVIDEGSRNGTWVNGRRLRGAAVLRPGDRLRIGRWEARYAGTLRPLAPE